MLITRNERPALLHIGIDVHQKSSVFNVFDPKEGRPGGTHRSQKVETTADGFRKVLEPLAGRCEVVFEVGPMAQWVADLVRPYATKITVANPSQIPWLFRSGRKNDRIDAQKLSILSYLDQVPKVHLPPPDSTSFRAATVREWLYREPHAAAGSQRFRRRFHLRLGPAATHRSAAPSAPIPSPHSNGVRGTSY